MKIEDCYVCNGCTYEPMCGKKKDVKVKQDRQNKEYARAGVGTLVWCPDRIPELGNLMQVYRDLGYTEDKANAVEKTE